MNYISEFTVLFLSRLVQDLLQMIDPTSNTLIEQIFWCNFSVFQNVYKYIYR